MPATEATPPPPWHSADWKAAALLAGIPALLLSVAAATGYPLITGDDLVQNFPLEELSGQILRHGHLPLWNGFLWSGSPLLGGTVGHALLPITLLFALLPPLAAWVAGEVLVLAAAAIGCQLFLRRTGCSPLAAGLGGAMYGLGGFVSSQIVHIDFAAAAAALPFVLVALHGLAVRSPAARPRHCLLLAVAAAWICLCGSPDIVIDTVVAAGAYLLHLWLQPLAPERRRVGRASLWLWSLLGGACGLAIGALQWLPSADFVAASERAHPSFAYISGGSLNGGNFLELLVPHVLGGGLVGTRAFTGSFPLAEVNAYPGVLALAAVFALLVRWRDPEAWRWRVWLVVCALAFVVVSGDHTPFEHLVAALPVVGDQRLPSRGLILFALSSALLGGYFLDSLLRLHPGRRQVTAGLLPLAGIAAVVLATIVTDRPAGGALGLHPGWTLAGVTPDLLISLAVALAAGALLIFGRRLRHPWRAAAVTALVVADLVLFDLNQSSLAPAYTSQLQPSEAAAVAALAGGGRYLVVDPAVSAGRALDALGAPDLGVVDELPDAGGYGSLTWAPYAAATGTHVQDAVTAAALGGGTLSALGVTTLLVLPSELAGPAAPGSTIEPGGDVVRWFGRRLPVSSVSIAAPPGTQRGSLRMLGASLRLVGDGGKAVAAGGVVSVSLTTVTVSFAAAPSAAGLELHTGVAVPAPLVRTRGGGSFHAGGPLAAAVAGGGWVETGTLDGFAVLQRAADAAYSLAAPGGSASVIAEDPWTGSASVAVSAPVATTLVRSVSDVPGWRATVTHDGSDAPADVLRHGLVQSVAVPAGRSVVTFSYVAPGWRLAQLLALAGAAGCLGLAVAAAVLPRRAARRRRRKRRHRRGRSAEELSEAGVPSRSPA